MSCLWLFVDYCPCFYAILWSESTAAIYPSSRKFTKQLFCFVLLLIVYNVTLLLHVACAVCPGPDDITSPTLTWRVCKHPFHRFTANHHHYHHYRYHQHIFFSAPPPFSWIHWSPLLLHHLFLQAFWLTEVPSPETCGNTGNNFQYVGSNSYHTIAVASAVFLTFSLNCLFVAARIKDSSTACTFSGFTRANLSSLHMRNKVNKIEIECS